MYWLKRHIWNIITIILVILLVLCYMFRVAIIDGTSMDPTLQDGEYVWTQHYFTNGQKAASIEVNDIIIAKSPDNPASYEQSFTLIGQELVIKRVMAVPGDTVEIKSGVLYVNGVEEDYNGTQHGLIYQPDCKFVLGEDQYWLEGDNRSVSLDSTVYGPVSVDLIVGEYIQPADGVNKVMTFISSTFGSTANFLIVVTAFLIGITFIYETKVKKNPKFNKVTTKWELKRCLQIRKTVFIKEQKVPVDLEIDEYDNVTDPNVIHMIMYIGDKYIGTCRLLKKDNVAKVGRVAILKKYRKKGYGKLLIEQAEIEAQKVWEFDTFYLEAQLHAQAFYENLGYQTYDNEIFMDAGIEHIKMKKENK